MCVGLSIGCMIRHCPINAATSFRPFHSAHVLHLGISLLGGVVLPFPYLFTCETLLFCAFAGIVACCPIFGSVITCCPVVGNVALAVPSLVAWCLLLYCSGIVLCCPEDYISYVDAHVFTQLHNTSFIEFEFYPPLPISFLSPLEEGVINLRLSSTSLLAIHRPCRVLIILVINLSTFLKDEVIASLLVRTILPQMTPIKNPDSTYIIVSSLYHAKSYSKFHTLVMVMEYWFLDAHYEYDPLYCMVVDTKHPATQEDPRSTSASQIARPDLVANHNHAMDVVNLLMELGCQVTQQENIPSLLPGETSVKVSVRLTAGCKLLPRGKATKRLELKEINSLGIPLCHCSLFAICQGSSLQAITIWVAISMMWNTMHAMGLQLDKVQCTESQNQNKQLQKQILAGTHRFRKGNGTNVGLFCNASTYLCSYWLCMLLLVSLEVNYKPGLLVKHHIIALALNMKLGNAARNTNPLDPDYVLPSCEPPPAYEPKFYRDRFQNTGSSDERAVMIILMDLADIPGAHPQRLIKHSERNQMNVVDIDGTSPGWRPIHRRRFGKTPRDLCLTVQDINIPVQRMIRDSLSQAYLDIEGSHPNFLTNSRSDGCPQDLSLRTEDIEVGNLSFIFCLLLISELAYLLHGHSWKWVHLVLVCYGDKIFSNCESVDVVYFMAAPLPKPTPQVGINVKFEVGNSKNKGRVGFFGSKLLLSTCQSPSGTMNAPTEFYGIMALWITPISISVSYRSSQNDLNYMLVPV
eukprot:Gb_03457 [translate_table: standard]